MTASAFFRRFVAQTKLRIGQGYGLPTIGVNRKAGTRILLVANAYIPTLQIWFVHPLKEYYESGKIFSQILTEQHLKEKFGKDLRTAMSATYVGNLVEECRPDVVIFCRYSGPHVDRILASAKKIGAKTIFHIDDDLLNIPLELGKKKYAFHNHPLRLEAVRKLLNDADMVFSSTASLSERLASYGTRAPINTGIVSCWGEVIAPPVMLGGGRIKIGYMGFDHEHDLKVALDGLIRILDRYPNVIFELFGKIPKPTELDRFGARVILHPPILSDYDQFLKEFTAMGWAIGICPLADTPFNRLKSINKWIEYTSVGAAVIATGGSIYDECCARGRGIIVDSPCKWEGALSRLIEYPDERVEMVKRAQQEVGLSYSREQFVQQLMPLLCN